MRATGQKRTGRRGGTDASIADINALPATVGDIANFEHLNTQRTDETLTLTNNIYNK